MEPDFYAMLQQMAPDQRQQILGLMAVPQENAQLEGQIAQAQALRRPSGQQFYEWGGTALNGAGDFLRQIAGATKENRYRGQMDANMAKLKSGTNPLFDMFRQKAQAEALRRQHPFVAAPVSDDGTRDWGY